jgi:hypothetical protein
MEPEDEDENDDEDGGRRKRLMVEGGWLMGERCISRLTRRHGFG